LSPEYVLILLEAEMRTGQPEINDLKQFSEKLEQEWLCQKDAMFLNKTGELFSTNESGNTFGN